MASIHGSLTRFLPLSHAPSPCPYVHLTTSLMGGWMGLTAGMFASHTFAESFCINSEVLWLYDAVIYVAHIDLWAAMV